MCISSANDRLSLESASQFSGFSFCFGFFDLPSDNSLAVLHENIRGLFKHWDKLLAVFGIIEWDGTILFAGVSRILVNW